MARRAIAAAVRVKRAVGAWAQALARHYRGRGAREVALVASREVLASPRRWPAAFALVVTAWATLVVWGRLIAPLATTPYFRPQGRFQTIAFFENGTVPRAGPGSGAGTGGAAGPGEPTVPLFVDSLPTLEKYAGLFDTVSPFWYSVGPAGDIATSGYRAEVMALARAKRLTVIPLVNNLKEGPGNGWDALRTPAARERTISALTDLAVSGKFDGLNLGFELMPAQARADYATFVKELAAALHGHGLTLAVSVYPDVEVPPEVSGFYDYGAIGAAADYVVLLAYDRHWTNTGPGPIAPLGWAEASLDSLLTHVPARKVVLGVGTHAYDWPVEAGAGITEYLPASVALTRAGEVGATVETDATSGERFYRYQADTGVRREVWLQDGPDLASKASLARRKGLRGVAVWRLGFSEPGALELFGQAVGRRP